VQTGWNTLAGADTAQIVAAVAQYRQNPTPSYLSDLYGNGRASEEIVAAMEQQRR
jgi:UDP-GlcNAc3NAcA epimerase